MNREKTPPGIPVNLGWFLCETILRRPRGGSFRCLVHLERNKRLARRDEAIRRKHPIPRASSCIFLVFCEKILRRFRMVLFGVLFGLLQRRNVFATRLLIYLPQRGRDHCSWQDMLLRILVPTTTSTRLGVCCVRDLVV